MHLQIISLTTHSMMYKLEVAQQLLKCLQRDSNCRHRDQMKETRELEAHADPSDSKMKAIQATKRPTICQVIVEPSKTRATRKQKTCSRASRQMDLSSRQARGIQRK